MTEYISKENARIDPIHQPLYYLSKQPLQIAHEYMRRCVLQSCLTQWTFERDALREKMRTRDDVSTRVRWCRDLANSRGYNERQSLMMYQGYLTEAMAEANGKVSEFSIKIKQQLMVIE